MRRPSSSRRGQLADDRFGARARQAIHVVAVLEDRAERLGHRFGLEVVGVQRHQAHRPVERLGHAGRLGQPEPAHHLHEAGDLLGQQMVDAFDLGLDDADFLVEVRIVDPQVQAAPLERVGQLARAVRGQHHVRPMLGVDRAELRDRHLEVGQHFEQERLELLVGAIDLVDQQHRRLVLARDRAAAAAA